MMKTCLRFASPAFCSILKIGLLFGFVHDLKAQSDSLVDVFPLAVANQWTYRYYTEYGSGAGVETITDSGRSIYSVAGAIYSADSTRWLIRQTRDLIHRRVFFNMVTTYPIRDSSTFELFERHQGQHQLYRNEDPTPVRLDVFPFTRDFSDTTFIYRFRRVGVGDTVVFKSTNRASQSQSFRSTFTFKRGGGLVRFRYNSGTLDIYEIAEHYLLNRIIASAASPRENSFPEIFALYQNYPNPFNPTTTLSYSVTQPGYVSLKIYDLLGREVTTLVSGTVDAGTHEVQWDASGIASGVYLYRLQAGSFISVKKMILLR